MTHEALIDANDSNDVRTQVNSYGDYLRSSREALGFSIDEVAVELHLARDIILYIEQEVLTSLPDPIFVRGYLRAYAKLVQADPDQVIASFNKVCAPDDNKKLNFGKHVVIKEMKASSEKPMRWVSYIIFIGLIVLLLMWWHGHNNQTDSSDNGTMAALATLKPVNDSSVSSTSPNQTVVTNVNSDSTSHANTTGAMTSTTTAASNASQAVSSTPNPNVIVNTNVQNLAPNSNRPASAVGSTSTPGATSNATQQPGESLANTPTPVVGSSASVTSASSNTSPAKPAKPKAQAASTWRNPDLQ